ncbi:MAG: winged helix-turn-helix transcriptional regulator [Candidatus Heimdallarchaeota archaeon]|nr:winged helix-turn-helix transcriptional regulator [Candidatus Heimdallarchaeota archaeon]
MNNLEERLGRYIESEVCACTSINDHLTKLKDLNNEITRDLTTLAKSLKILAEPNRLRIIYLLKDKSLCLCELEYILNLSQPTITHHIKKLKSIGIIRLEKEGRWTSAKLIRPEIIDSLNSLNEILS